MQLQTKAGRPKGRSKEQTLALILPKARLLFSEKGFAQTTIKLVANSCGLSHAAMYSYFANKQDLYLATVADVQQQLLPFYVEAFEQGSNLRERMGLVFKAMAQEHDKDSSITGLLAAVPIEMRRHPELAEQLRANNNDIVSVLEAMFNEAKASGEITTNASAEDLVNVFLGAGVGVSLYHYGLERDNLTATMDVFIELINGQIFSKG